MWLRSDCVIEEHYGRCLVAKSKCALPLRSRRIRSRLNCIDAGSVKRLSRHKPLVACRQAPALFIPRPLDLGIKSAGDKLFLSLIRHPLFDKRGWSRDRVRVRRSGTGPDNENRPEPLTAPAFRQHRLGEAPIFGGFICRGQRLRHVRRRGGRRPRCRPRHCRRDG